MTPQPGAPPDIIGTLLDRAVRAVNRGDLAAAHDMAGRVLAEDAQNREAFDLLSTGEEATGELRRLTIMSCDLVGSTELSERLDPERYRELVRGYKRRVRQIIEGRYDGHIVSVKGDGIFALFGYPAAHEDDATRAVRACRDICREVREFSVETEAYIGEAIEVRAAVHRGLVFIDVAEDDVYGLAANVTARLESLAEPGRVVVSDEVRRLVADRFDLRPGEAQSVKGLTAPLATYTVVSEDHEPGRPQSNSPLVGRRAELEALRSAWDGVQQGEAGSGQGGILIHGEPGIGKSRLAATIVAEARAAGAQVVELAGSPFHTDAGFHPVQRLLEMRCGIGSESPATERLALLRQELKATGAGDDAIGLLAPVLGLSPEAGYQPASAEGRKLNEQITEAITGHLLGCFGAEPGLLLAEDVHWFDASTMALLGQLLDAPRDRLLVVITSREDLPVTTSITLELEPLADMACHELIDALTDGALDASSRQAVVARSDGIPLFVEELLRTGPPTAHGTAGEVPDILYEPLVARLHATAHGLPVAAAVATVGRTIDRGLLDAAVELSEGDLDTELDALVEGNVLIRLDRGERYRFRHELLREVAYELQPLTERRRLHGRVADLLIGNAPDSLVDWPAVAAHLTEALRHQEASDAYREAARRARNRGAIPEARSHLGRAIHLIQDLPEDRERMRREVGLRLRRGFLAMSAEAVGSPDAAIDFARCLELAVADPQGDEMFSTLISLWAYHLSRAELDRARTVLDTLRPELQGSREYFGAANRAGYGMIEWFEGDFQRSLITLEEAVAQLSIDPEHRMDSVWFVPNDPVASMYVHLALARFISGDTAGADAELERASQTSADLGFPQGPWSRAYGTWLGAWMGIERGDFAGAIADSEALVDQASGFGFDGWAMIAATNQAAAQAAGAAADPECPSADAALHAATLTGLTSMWQMVELLVFLPYYLTAAASALAASGDIDAARARCEEADALAERTGMRFYQAETGRQLALLADDEDAAIAGLEAALKLAQGQGARLFELRIALDLHARGAPGSRSALAEVVAAFPDGADLHDLARARARLTGGP